MYMYIYICVCVCDICICMCMYIHLCILCKGGISFIRSHEKLKFHGGLIGFDWGVIVEQILRCI